jgi:uncharacterized protein (DUF305 family)
MNRKQLTLIIGASTLLAACATTPAPDVGGTGAAARAGTAAPGGDHATHAGHAAGATDGRQRTGYTAADVRFMQHMIAHHSQALVMSALVPERTARPELRLLAERIEVSQRDEIAQMQRWLRQRGEALPAEDAHVHAAMGHGELMVGMLTQQELDALARARGSDFDRLFLELMIKHHEGALIMVEELYRQPASGQEPELFVLASDVDADQRAEIQRMRRLLATIGGTR